jgi:hypothetical protein
VTASSRPELQDFLALSAEQQAQVIRRMAAAGWSDQGIASATRLSVEQVRRVLAPAPSKEAHCPRSGIPTRFCTCIGPHEGKR